MNDITKMKTDKYRNKLHLGGEVAAKLIKNLEEDGNDEVEKNVTWLTAAFRRYVPHMRELLYEEATQYAKKRAQLARENWEFYRENKKFKSEEEEARRLKRFMQKKYLDGAENFLYKSEKRIEFDIFYHYSELFDTYHQFYVFSKKNIYLIYSGTYDIMRNDSESIRVSDYELQNTNFFHATRVKAV